MDVSPNFRTSVANSSCLIAHGKYARTHAELFDSSVNFSLAGYYRPSGDHETFEYVGGIEVANLRRKLLRNSLQQGGFHIYCDMLISRQLGLSRIFHTWLASGFRMAYPVVGSASISAKLFVQRQPNALLIRARARACHRNRVFWITTNRFDYDYANKHDFRSCNVKKT